jgi:hypothetical protein
MNSVTSRNRLINGDGYVLVMEEVTSTIVLHDMFSQMSSLIAGAGEVVKELGEAIPNLSGLQFVVLHYYDDFVSPSNFQGYALVMLTLVPDQTNDIIRDIITYAPDEELGRVLLLASRNDETQQKFRVLKEESSRVVQARVKTLRSL